MATHGLATRCPVCSTVFRVVPDQLRVSEGWVRCGRCAEVFNASLSLVDMETGAPRAAPDGLPGGLPTSSAAAPTAANPAHPAWPEQPAAHPYAHPRAHPHNHPPVQRPSAVVRYGVDRKPPPSPPPPPEATPATVQAPWEPEPEHHDAPPKAPQGPAAPAVPSDPRAEPDDRPAFVQQADRAARWQRPRVRRALGGAAVAAALALVLQMSYQYRELIAAGWPSTRPALQQGCAVLGCRLTAAHAIDSLAVESSGLLRVEKTNTYSLSVSLRNRAGYEVALPALELSLTDSRGRLIARRVLNTRELGSAQNTVTAGGDVALQATLLMAAAAAPEREVPAEPQAEPQQVAGYTIELFYP